MADELNWLLTDEFIAFSAKIKVIHENKKAKKHELKEIYSKFQVEFEALDKEARKAEDDFQAWKKSQEGSKGIHMVSSSGNTINPVEEK